LKHFGKKKKKQVSSSGPLMRARYLEKPRFLARGPITVMAGWMPFEGKQRPSGFVDLALAHHGRKKDVGRPVHFGDAALPVEHERVGT